MCFDTIEINLVNFSFYNILGFWVSQFSSAEFWLFFDSSLQFKLRDLIILSISLSLWLQSSKEREVWSTKKDRSSLNFGFVPLLWSESASQGAVGRILSSIVLPESSSVKILKRVKIEK